MFFELLKEAYTHLWIRKFRTGIAALGIFWGIYAITILISLGQGFYAYQIKAIQPFTKTILFVILSATNKAYQGVPADHRLFLTQEEVMALPKIFPDILAITPMQTQNDLNFVTAEKQNTGTLQGVAANYSQMTTRAYRGRTLSPEDIVQHRQVVFLSKEMKQNLFPHQEPLGKTVSINQIYFKIIGYATEQGGVSLSIAGAEIPYSVFGDLYSNQVTTFLLNLKLHSNERVFQKQLRNYLAHKLHFSLQDQNAVHIINFTQYAKTFIHILILAKYFLLFCGLMSLVVGSIGIANMMYMMIKERTHEIGLKMALGANPSWILLEVMLETGILILSTGFLALFCALVSIALLQQANLPYWLGKPAIVPSDFSLILIILLLTSCIVGYFPAQHAAKLSPINALNDK